MDAYIRHAIVLTIGYFLVTFFTGNNLFWFFMTSALIVFNSGVSLSILFRQGRISLSVIVLNILQLFLFCRIHSQIFHVFGSHNYIFDQYPAGLDWILLVGTYSIRAVDLLDIMEAYGIKILHIENNGLISGLALLYMNLIVSFFIISALLKHFRIRSKYKEEESTFMDSLVHLRRIGLVVCGVAFFMIFGNDFRRMIMEGTAVDRFDLFNLWLWPIDNILRTVDFGDAFHIFHWRLHSLDMSFSLATLSVFFRLIIGAYTLGFVNFLLFNFLDAPGKTIDDYIEIIQSPKSPLYEKETAIKRLCQFRTDSDKIVDCLVDSIEFSNEKIRYQVTEKLKNASPAGIKSLAEKLFDPRLYVRNAAMNILQTMDCDLKNSEDMGSVIKRLVNRLSNPKWEIREHAQTALMTIDPDWRERKEVTDSVAEFVDRLRYSDQEIRGFAALALGTIGPVAQSSLPDLEKMLKDENTFVRTEAEKALKKIRG